MGFDGYTDAALIKEAERLEDQIERRILRDGRDEVYWSLVDKLDHIYEELEFREGEEQALIETEEQNEDRIKGPYYEG